MNELFKKIPNVNNILNELKNSYTIEDETLLKESIDLILVELRQNIKDKKVNEIDLNKMHADIYDNYQKQRAFKLKKCLNGTGVIIHTNLGRSLLSAEQLANIDTLKSYNNLEFNVETLQRGSRYDLVEEAICKVTKAEAAMVVNNNAAAVMLVFNEFAKDKEVLVSNSELVEIGGSFRIPEIIKLSGAIMNNVGTTNKTKLSDYTKAITSNTGLLAKIHQSNFYIEGFVASVSAKELVDYRNENNLDLVIYEDLASGAIFDFSCYGLDKEPTVIESVESGIDLISFSGDKLLGGIQAGVIIGKEEYVSRLKKNQLLRVIRPSGLVLNIVEATFKNYLDEKLAQKTIPTFKLLTEDPKMAYNRATKVKEMISDLYECQVIESSGAVGGGCMPKTKLSSYALSIKLTDPQKLKEFLASAKTPIITLINDDNLVIDFKAIFAEDLAYLIEQLKGYQS